MPFGYRRIKIQDGAKKRPTLEVNPDTGPIIKETFEKSLRGVGLKEIAADLNQRGITSKGERWQRTGLHSVLTNEAYTGTAVWGRTTTGDKEPEPVRAEGAWVALVFREMFESVQRGLEERAPKRSTPWPANSVATYTRSRPNWLMSAVGSTDTMRRWKRRS